MLPRLRALSGPLRMVGLLFCALYLGGLSGEAIGACNNNYICEPPNEDPSNCGDCYCGDEICQPGEGGCSGCPYDCYSQCYCGDWSCGWPAEGGGQYGSQYCGDGSQPEHCSFCERDCGGCDECAWMTEYGPSCDPSSGDCGYCLNRSWCPEAAGWDCVSGTCIYYSTCPVKE
jgi:hypothetical protein